MIFEHYHKVFNKIPLLENFGKALCRKRLISTFRISICVHKNLPFILEKTRACFHAQEWCHLFTWECFDQKSRKSVHSTHPPLSEFLGMKQIDEPRKTQLFYPKTTNCANFIPLGWSGCAVTWVTLSPSLPLYTISGSHPGPLTPAQISPSKALQHRDPS